MSGFRLWNDSLLRVLKQHSKQDLLAGAGNRVGWFNRKPPLANLRVFLVRAFVIAIQEYIEVLIVVASY
jgi:hypothetical protein